MNHQEAKDLLAKILPEDALNLVKVEVFRLSWTGKGYNVVADETGYEHDYVRKAGAKLWRELTKAMGCSVTKRNFRPLIEEKLVSSSEERRHQLEYPGGALGFSSPFYIERTDEEADVYREIMQPGSVVRIKGPRKMGKSSLMLRVLDQAESEGFRIVNIDFMQADGSILSDLDELLRWLCRNIAAQLSLEVNPDDQWNPLIGSKLSCSNFLQEHVLSAGNPPLVLVINELNRIFDNENISRDFLPLLRSWFEEAKHNEAMKNLRQVLVYSTEVYVQLDMNLSPFNVGLPIELRPFTGEQLASLAAVYGFKWKADGNANSPITLMLNELGGHPYLCQLTLYHLASQEGLIESPSKALQALIQSGSELGGIYTDFLQQLFEDAVSSERTVAAIKVLAAGEEASLSRIELYQLERLGLISLRGGEPRLISRLFTSYLISML